MNAEIQALKRCPMILANSTAILKDISEVYEMDLMARPHVVVPHGIEDIEDHEGLLEQRIQARKSSPDAPVRLLFLGRLETRKGIAHLVPALRRLLAEQPNVQVDLVGDKHDPANLRLVEDLLAAHPERVRWHGFLEDDALDGLMRQADIFVAPSLYESFGLIYVEAGATGCPSVAFEVGGVPEVVSHGSDGLLAAPEDTDALFAAMQELVVNPELRDNLSRGARKTFETRFHYRQMAERLEEVYRETRSAQP